MNCKKYVAMLLLLVIFLLTGCDFIVNLTVDKTEEVSNDASGDATNKEPSQTTPPLYEESGTLFSEESDLLVLFADWKAVSYDGKTAEVTVKVGIVCYGISTGKHDLIVKVNGETQTLTTRAIESKINEKKKFTFATLHFDAKLTKPYRGILDISAIWDYNGNYSGQQIDLLSTEAVISFPGGELIDSEEITTQTEEPETTDKPNVDPDPPLYKEKGTLSSTESDLLVLFADWEVVSEDGETATLTVKLGVSCYSISTGKHLLTVTVNEEEETFMTPQISNTVNEKKTIYFNENSPLEFEIELDGNEPYSLDISVVWDYNGTYHGQHFDDLIIEETIVFPNEALSVSEDTEELELSSNE